MANEVTKKDLQSLQGQFNKQLGELTAAIERSFVSVEKTANTKLQTLVDSTNKAILDLTKQHNDLVATVNQHAKVINDLKK